MPVEQTNNTLPVALFIAAHANDIEVGAGGTCAKLIKDGWDVWYCILTNAADKEMRQKNKKEVTAAAQVLGVPSQKILLLNFIDEEFTCNHISVGYFRQILKRFDLNPDLVFTHTPHDSHQDHRTAYDLTLATFRKKEILSYSVAGSLVKTGFKPEVFVDIEGYYDTKKQALESFSSQQVRLDYDALATGCAYYKEATGLDCAEGFELVRQEGASALCADSINDAVFQRFWQEVLEGRTLAVVYPMEQQSSDVLWTKREREGLSKLQQSFSRSPYEKDHVSTHNCQGEDIEMLFRTSDVLISGGMEENDVVEQYFNSIEGIRYVISRNKNGYYVEDREQGEDLHASYAVAGGKKAVLYDIGVLTIIQNPDNPNYKIIGCMGVDGAAAYACYCALTEPQLQQQLMSLVTWPFSSHGFQILLSYEPEKENVRILKDSLHIVQKEPSFELNRPPFKALD